jgi:hypothetical protein
MMTATKTPNEEGGKEEKLNSCSQQSDTKRSYAHAHKATERNQCHEKRMTSIDYTTQKISSLTPLEWNFDQYSTFDFSDLNNDCKVDQKNDDDDDDNVPEEFICPLTLEVMTIPMMTRTGQNYERDAILCWLKKHSHCPMTRQTLSLRDCVINSALRLKIQNWHLQCRHAKNGKDDDKDDSEYLAECCFGSVTDELGLAYQCAPSEHLIRVVEQRDNLDNQILAKILKNARKLVKHERRHQRERELQERHQPLNQPHHSNGPTREPQPVPASTAPAAATTATENSGSDARRRRRGRFRFKSLYATAA